MSRGFSISVRNLYHFHRLWHIMSGGSKVTEMPSCCVVRDSVNIQNSRVSATGAIVLLDSFCRMGQSYYLNKPSSGYKSATCIACEAIFVILLLGVSPTLTSCGRSTGRHIACTSIDNVRFYSMLLSSAPNEHGRTLPGILPVERGIANKPSSRPHCFRQG